MDLTPFLRLMTERRASDCFFSVGAPPSIKIEGESEYVGHVPLSREDVQSMIDGLLDDARRQEFQTNLELNLAFDAPGIGRFRANLYRQRGQPAMALRYISAEIPSIAALNLPHKLEELVMLPRGLVLVVGAAGSGKSTTLAAMIDWRNTHKAGHILTIEEPIEYVHRHKASIVDQREIGIDTLSYENALKNAMREAPDVILIGEIRDRETMKHAIAYAETGHLCLSTLHANNANQTLDRILNFFPESARHQVLLDLSLNLQAVISMRLVQGINRRRLPAVELLLRTPYVADLIERGEVAKLKDAMWQGVDIGMQTFDEALYRLYTDGRISAAEALAHADSRNDLALRIRLAGGGASDTSLELDGVP